MNICFVCLLWTSICGCGSGESGCSACGCCKACARELDGQEARQRGIFDAVKEMIPLDLLLGMLNDIFQHIKAQILIVLAQWQMQGASQRTAHAILVHVSVKVQREWAMKYSSKDLKKKGLSVCHISRHSEIALPITVRNRETAFPRSPWVLCMVYTCIWESNSGTQHC